MSDAAVYNPPTITVYPLKKNKRPVGYAPWPDEPKPKKKRRKKRKR